MADWLLTDCYHRVRAINTWSTSLFPDQVHLLQIRQSKYPSEKKVDFFYCNIRPKTSSSVYISSSFRDDVLMVTISREPLQKKSSKWLFFICWLCIQHCNYLQLNPTDTLVGDYSTNVKWPLETKSRNRRLARFDKKKRKTWMATSD